MFQQAGHVREAPPRVLEGLDLVLLIVGQSRFRKMSQEVLFDDVRQVQVVRPVVVSEPTASVSQRCDGDINLCLLPFLHKGRRGWAALLVQEPLKLLDAYVVANLTAVGGPVGWPEIVSRRRSGIAVDVANRARHHGKPGRDVVAECRGGITRLHGRLLPPQTGSQASGLPRRDRPRRSKPPAVGPSAYRLG